jgi:DNA-binding transcriptional ArsR family regulator
MTDHDSAALRDEEQLRSLFAAMAHPVRGMVLATLASNRDGLGITIRNLATTMGQSRRKIRYHIDFLVGQDLAEIAFEGPCRGVIERSYRCSRPPLVANDEEWLMLSQTQAKMISLMVLRLTVADVTAAMAAGSYPLPGKHIEARTSVQVDGQGWDELMEIQRQAHIGIEATVEATSKRLRSSEEETVPVVVALFLLQTQSLR